MLKNNIFYKKNPEISLLKNCGGVCCTAGAACQGSSKKRKNTSSEIILGHCELLQRFDKHPGSFPLMANPMAGQVASSGQQAAECARAAAAVSPPPAEVGRP